MGLCEINCLVDIYPINKPALKFNCDSEPFSTALLRCLRMVLEIKSKALISIRISIFLEKSFCPPLETMRSSYLQISASDSQVPGRSFRDLALY